MLRKLLTRLAPSGGAAPSSAQRDARSPEQLAEGLIAEGNAAERDGRLAEACRCYRAAVAAAPRYAKAHVNLGIGLEASGDVEGAMASWVAALAIDPGEPFAHYNLGRARFGRGLLAESETHLRSALQRRAEFPEALIMLSSVLDANGDCAGAAAMLESALRLREADFGAWYHYGMLLKKLDRAGDAEAALQRAHALDPANADASYELGLLLMARGALLEAGRHLRTAAALQPDSKAARAALFHLCDAQGDLPGAAAELEAALKVFPDWVDAHYNHGMILKRLQRLEAAEAAFRRALALDPAYFRAEHMLGSVLLGQARVAEALDRYRAACAQCPGSFELKSAELFGLNCHDGVSSEELFERHRAFGAEIEAAYASRFEPHANLRDPDRRLRIGYVSGDFCYHVVTLFMIPVLEHHDRARFEVYCYSTGGRSDEYTRRLAALPDVWRDARNLSERELADLVLTDRIDILVDLGGHSGVPNLAVFAQRPAPVQATWLGYLNTTGMTRIHYRITDRYSDPPGLAERQHTERLAWLPQSQWCYRPFIPVAPAATAPLARNGHVTFGSFNQASKLSRSARRLWAEILRGVPGARLTAVGLPEGRARRDFLEDFAAEGIERERITVQPYVALADYLRLYDSVDIALDALPYSGGTTTFDALWMGVPVVTLPGARSSSRSAASILSTLGLEDWIADSPEAYVRVATRMAEDPDRLLGLRASLRARIEGSALMDERQFTRDLEAAFRGMWRAWCEGFPS